jgi:hypothetical protein
MEGTFFQGAQLGRLGLNWAEPLLGKPVIILPSPNANARRFMTDRCINLPPAPLSVHSIKANNFLASVRSNDRSRISSVRSVYRSRSARKYGDTADDYVGPAANTLNPSKPLIRRLAINDRTFAIAPMQNKHHDQSVISIPSFPSSIAFAPTH